MLLLPQLGVFSLHLVALAHSQGCHGWFWDPDWGVGGATASETAFATALAFVLAIGAGAIAVASATAVINGCCVEGGAGAGVGWAGAGLAFTTGSVGGAIAVPFVVAA